LSKKNDYNKINKGGMIEMFLGKKAEIEAEKEVKIRQVSPA